MNEIRGFKDENRFLSNFYPSKITFYNMVFSSVEAAFQAAKCIHPEDRAAFCDLSPQEAKQRGRKLELRPDWEQRKHTIMHNLLIHKFSENPELLVKLLATENAFLIEENNWHDNYWGNCSCDKCRDKIGLNLLGKALMRVRSEFGGQMACPKDEVSVVLPDGQKIYATVEPAGEYPGISIWKENLETINGREELCFIEHNPDRRPGHQLCIGAYTVDEDEPDYYKSYCPDPAAPNCE